MTIFINGQDIGYRDKQNWWSDPSNEDAFRIANLDEDYPTEYFENDHVSEKTVESYCNSVIRQYELFTGTRLKSIVEFGSGGGWFAKEFKERGYSIQPLEGSRSGVAKCHNKSLWETRRTDFRMVMPQPKTKYDIALCTEVAEHIEPPFSATLVHNLVEYSDLVWWSSEEPNTNKPHLHHSNEQPYRYWVNLFRHYNYESILLPDEIYNACDGRGRYMFYNTRKFIR